MEILLKRHFWIVTLIGLGVVAWLTAGSITAFIGVQLSKAGRDADKLQVAANGGESTLDKRLREGRLREESGAMMSGRSIFLIEEPPPPEPEPEEEAPTDEAPAAPPVPTFEPTTLPIKLLGTMVVLPETWSSASMELERKDQKIVSIGTELLNGQATVHAIRRNYVVLKEGDKLTIAPLFPKEGGDMAGAGGAVQPSPAMPQPDRPPRATVQSEPTVEGVRKVGEGAYQMDRSHVNAKLKDVAQLGTQVRIVPNYHNGKYEGFRMIGMQGSSLFKEIGFENGDIVQAINGERIDSPNKALALYEALKNKSRVTVLIERGGVAKTLRYTVR